jgi:serine/threonine protein kinase
MELEGHDASGIRSFYQALVQDITKEIDLMSELRGNSHIVSFKDHMIIDRSLVVSSEFGSRYSEDNNFSTAPRIPQSYPRQHDTAVSSAVQRTNELGWDVLIRMELLKSLADHIKEQPMTLSEVYKLGIHICRALELCAMKNIIHRDIKAENIFVSPYGEYKLGDFGIARQIERTMSGLSKKGTYSTMAPEVFKGERYGSNVDTYSLGIVLYSLLNQYRPPFLPEYPNPILPNDRDNALQRRMSAEPIPPLKDVSPDLNALILTACAYDRDQRFISPTHMREALESVEKGMGFAQQISPVSSGGTKLLFPPHMVQGGVGVFRKEGGSVLVQQAVQNDTKGVGVDVGTIAFSFENFGRHG